MWLKAIHGLNNMKKVRLFESFINEAKISFGKKGIKAKLQDKLTIAQKAIDKWGDAYQGVYDRLEKSIKSGKLDYKNILYVQGGSPLGSYDLYEKGNAFELATQISKVVKKYKKHEVETTKVGAMAGYGSAMSTVGGEIKAHVNFSNGNNFYSMAVTVGGGVDRSIKDKIFQEVYELMFVLDQYNGEDGGVSIKHNTGTNYDTLGIGHSRGQFNGAMEAQINNIFVK